MTAPLRPDFEDPEEPALAAVSELLSNTRPAPDPGFRDALRARLVAADPGWGPRPARLWLPSLALTGVGSALLVLGALVAVH